MALSKAIRSGSVASLASAIALAACGKAEIDDAAAPINGPSQWVWGRHAKYEDGFSLRHTLVGFLVHHAASIWWAYFYERLRTRDAAHAGLEAAAATSAVAAFVDYRLTPHRFRPGFEKRLPKRSLFLVYAAFALGLAAATRLERRG